jgi:hypothetical protein
MPRTIWRVTHDGHRITLINHWSLVPPASMEKLVVDGETVAENHGNVFADMQSEIHARIGIGDGAFDVTGRVGRKGVRTGGQILINGRFAGGDEQLRFLDRGTLKTALRGGFPGFALRRGIWSFGLPYGLAMAALSHGRPTTFPEFATKTAFYGIPFGLFMSLVWYVYLRRALRNQPH